MAHLTVIFPEDVEHIIAGIWASAVATRPQVETETDRAKLIGFEAACRAFALSFGVDWKAENEA